MSEGPVEVVGFLELAAKLAVARALSLDFRPERTRMVHVPQVGKLVADHVVDERGWRLHEAPREPYLAARVAAAPTGSRRRDEDARRREPGDAREREGAAREVR